MVSLYTIPLPDADAGQPNNRIASQIQQSGLVQQGGVATEQIATSNVDLTLTGQWRYGERFARKTARELESLGEGSYAALPLFDADSAELRRETGYYELANVDVSPAHPTSEDVFEFTVGLNETGTRETHWRAVRTTQETVDTLFTGSDTSYVAIPTEATKTQWYDSQEGTEVATAVDTVEAEFGDVDRYDPTDSTFDNPILLYELDFDREGRIDTKVWDDRSRDKFFTYSDSQSNTVDINQWVHVFHTAWEFDGSPVIDTGRLRVWFDPPTGANRDDIYAERWDDVNDEWDTVGLPTTPYEVIDVDTTGIGPHEVQVQLLFSDGIDIFAIDGIFDRGDDSVLWIEPENGKLTERTELVVVSGETRTIEAGETLTRSRATINGTLDVDGTLELTDERTLTKSEIKDVLEPIARKTDTNVAPAQTVIARSETRR